MLQNSSVSLSKISRSSVLFALYLAEIWYSLIAGSHEPVRLERAWTALPVPGCHVSSRIPQPGWIREVFTVRRSPRPPIGTVSLKSCAIPFTSGAASPALFLCSQREVAVLKLCWNEPRTTQRGSRRRGRRCNCDGGYALATSLLLVTRIGRMGDQWPDSAAAPQWMPKRNTLTGRPASPGGTRRSPSHLTKCVPRCITRAKCKRPGVYKSELGPLRLRVFSDYPLSEPQSPTLFHYSTNRTT
jgi:hypothetical protein